MKEGKKMETESWEAGGRRAKSSGSERKTVTCATDETKLWLRPSVKQNRNPCSGSSPVYQDWSTRHYWPVKKAIVDLRIRLEGNLKRISGNLLRPLGAQNRDFGAASQTLLTGVKLILQGSLGGERIQNSRMKDKRNEV